MLRENPFKLIYETCNNKNKSEKCKLSIIDIEITNFCNFKCLMCPTGTGSIKRSQGMMSDETYYNIINQIKDTNIALRFIRWGEPTLHKKFFTYLEEAKNRNILTHFNTNGFLLTDNDLQKIIDLEVDSIKFSFQGVDKKSYNEMRNKGNFDELINKIKKLYNLRGNKEKPFIQVSTTTTYESEDLINEFRQDIMPYCDYINIGKTIMDYIDIENVDLNYEEKELFFDLKRKQKIVKNRFDICPEVFDKLSINWDGSVTACCADFDGKMIIGNLENENLFQIWNSDKLKNFREILKNKEYEKIDLCSTCYNRMNL